MSEINEEAVDNVEVDNTDAVNAEAENVSENAETVEKTTPTSFKQVEDTEPHWYVVHTYSGYEYKVKADIEKTIENRKLQGQMLEVMVPLQDVVETKNGVKKTVSKKMFPGYVLVHMIKNDVTWYVVRNTRGVTGFVGPGSEPVPLTEAEMKKLGVKIPNQVIDIDVELGDYIKVVSGAWEGTDGKIKDINAGKQTVTIDVDIFGRTTSVEISLTDIEKL